MKKRCFLLSLLFVSLVSFAQEVRVEHSNGKVGLFNDRTRKWVTAADFNNGLLLSSYKGHYYYALESNALWAIFDDLGSRVSDFIYDEVSNWSYNGLIPVRKDGDWGVVDTYGHILVPFQYMKVAVESSSAMCITWNNDITYLSTKSLIDERSKRIQKDNEENKRKEEQEKRRIEREKKEKELSSFTEYARGFVEPRINEWQNKGEFEKLADYRKRVTGPNRTAMIDSLTHVAEKNFISEHSNLHPENKLMSLEPYDAENEVFLIVSPKLGQMVLPVPIEEAPSFKDHFFSLEKKNAIYYIDNDKIALASMDFYDKETDKTYHFSNNDALNYNHYEVDPDTYQFNLVNIVTAKPVEVSDSNPASTPKRPVIIILSPEKNSTYSDPRVTIRYQASVSDGSSPVLHAWVNGLETEVLPKPKATSKGVAAGWDEVELILPKDKEHQCNVMLAVTDGSGYSSENKTISLQYVGEIPKPKLHLFSVGVSDYASPSLTKLGYASKDAKDFVSTISSSDVSMYDQIVTPVVITDASATKANIERGLATLTREVDQDDVVMLFFSGHGVLDGDDAYFMSVDAVSGDPYTGVDFSLIRKNMTKMKDKKCRVLIFMDACYSGAMFNAKSDLKSITFAEHDIIGFYSSTASQTSAEFSDDENGLFTKALIEGLKGNAKNQDGEITTIGLQKFISDYVNEQTSGKQSPIVENKLGDIVLYKVK